MKLVAVSLPVATIVAPTAMETATPTKAIPSGDSVIFLRIASIPPSRCIRWCACPEARRTAVPEILAEIQLPALNPTAMHPWLHITYFVSTRRFCRAMDYRTLFAGWFDQPVSCVA